MAIITPLTYTIANGQAVDATPLMADLNQIVNNVNANAAAINGSSAQVFNVANATTSTQAVNLGQVSQVPLQTFSYEGGTAANTTYGQTLTFSVPSSGYIIVNAFWSSNTMSALGGITEAIVVNGVVVATDAAVGANSWALSGMASVSPGVTSVIAEYVTGSTALANPVHIRGSAFFIPNP